MNRYKLASAIIQIVLALVLVGIALYYLIIDEAVSGVLFLVVGIVFIALSIRTIYKWMKERKNEEKNNNK